MQGLEATFDDLPFEAGDNPQRVLPKIVPFGAALAFAGAISVWALHWQGSTLSDAVSAVWWAPAPSVSQAMSKPFADITIDANLLAQLNSASPIQPSQQVASLEPAAPISPFPMPRLEAFPPSAPAIPPAGSIPLPPGRDVPQIDETESYPLPPARPPGFGAPTQTTAPDRHASRPDVAVARPASQPDNRNVIEKLFGWAHASAPVMPSTATARTAVTQPVVAERQESEPAAAGGLGRGPLFSFPSPFGNSAPAPVSGYDRYTAVYDISNRVVYLPDGTRLEAHSGLGQALDNPRFVAERAVGPTPPHLYELTLREGSFHGVQALRLNPIGEGGIYGRAGLLAHPFMLGPNGDSNGCVSFKDYDAFLRAYQNGQVKKIAVVAKL